VSAAIEGGVDALYQRIEGKARCPRAATTVDAEVKAAVDYMATPRNSRPNSRRSSKKTAPGRVCMARIAALPSL
jgi:hypothetical protein